MVKASLTAVIEDENAGYPGPVPQSQLAANLESHIEETLAGEGEVSEAVEETALKIHEPTTDEPAGDSPAIDPTLAERIRIPLGRDDVYAELYIRECDGSACVFYSGEVVVTIDDQLSRHGAISEAAHALYTYFMGTGEQSKKILAGHLNAYIANTIDDPTKIVPAGASCEWPLADEPKVEVAGGASADSFANPEFVHESLVAPAGPTDEFPNLVPLADGQADPAAVEIPALAGEACGGEGVVEVENLEAGYIDDSGKFVPLAEAEETFRRARAIGLYEHALSAAKDRYVSASQHRVQLQGEVKAAKDEEAERLEEINTIEARGWQAFLPAKPKLNVVTSTPAAAENPAPSIPSPPSTLPPPEAPFSPQAGVSAANDHPAPPAGGYHSDWQAVDIAALNLPKSLTTKLREAGHDTIGKLEALRGTFEGLLSIAGVGRTKADAIEEALLGWLTKNRDSSAINEVREKNRAAMVAGESVALEMAAQGQ